MKTPEPKLTLPISRRGLLQLLGAGAGLVLLPRCKRSSPSWPL